ncbi:hypothetical protein ACFQ0T_00110 [Kitasatospora gansuensis]
MTDTDLFQPGSTAVRRDVHAGRVWTAMPQRVIADTGHVLTLAYWPGIESLAPMSWITSTRTGDQSLRERMLTELAAGTWAVTAGPAPPCCRTSWSASGSPCTASRTLPASRCAGTLTSRNRISGGGVGIDTLDLVVTPDLSGPHWKDRDEYAQLRRLGVIDDYLHRQVERAKGRAITMLDNRTGPFMQAAGNLGPGPCVAAARTARRRRRPRLIRSSGSGAGTLVGPVAPSRTVNYPCRVHAARLGCDQGLDRGLAGGGFGRPGRQNKRWKRGGP